MLKIQARKYNTIVTINSVKTSTILTTNSGIIVPLPNTIHISDLIALIDDIDSIEDTLIDLEPIKTVKDETN